MVFKKNSYIFATVMVKDDFSILLYHTFDLIGLVTFIALVVLILTSIF